MTSADPQASSASPANPASLLGALRVGGVLLVFGFLSVIASYLIFQKGWVAPEVRDSTALTQLSGRFEDLRVAILEERIARGSSVGERASAAVERTPAAREEIERSAQATDRRWSDLRNVAAAARAAQILGNGDSRDPWVPLERAIQGWRLAANVNDRGAEDVAFVDVRRRLDEASATIRARDVEFNKAFDRLIAIRTWLLLGMSLAGGLAAWIATLYAIRRSRRSLRRIAEHVEAIESGELAPRSMESFEEISEINVRLNQLGDVLRHSREEARRESHAAGARQAELEFANDLVLELSRCRTEHEVIATFARRVPDALGAEGIEVLHLVDPPGILEELPPAPADESHPARIVADPASCLGFRAMTTAPAENDAIRCPASPRPAQAALCVPMQTAHGQIGVVHICARPGEPITNIPRGFAETLVRVFAPAMENARLLRESIERGATDPLTGLANRRRLFEFGSKALALAVRQQSPFAVVVLDVDRFKAINDEHGHEAGDRALVLLAKALQGTLRETDLAARIGGDEFALLLPGSSASAAAQVVERTRERLAEHQEKALSFPIHVSAGVAELSPPATGLNELLALADRALYDAKREGRPREGFRAHHAGN